jgi:hypothetical protein
MQTLPIICPVDLIGGNQKWHLTTTTLNYIHDLGMEISKELQTVGDILGREEGVIVGEKGNRRN